MKKTIVTAFLIIAVLVIAFIAWELMFADDGVLHSVYNGVANVVNESYANMAGDGAQVLNTWGDADDFEHDASERNTKRGTDQDVTTGMKN